MTPCPSCGDCLAPGDADLCSFCAGIQRMLTELRAFLAGRGVACGVSADARAARMCGNEGEAKARKGDLGG